MKLIHEIRQQPHHVRELTTLLCTIAVVAVVGLVWFHSFQKDIYGLLNPEEQKDAQDTLFATQSKSLFGSMFSTLGNSKAQILDLFSKKDTNVTPASSPTSSPAPVAHPLPVSNSR